MRPLLRMVHEPSATTVTVRVYSFPCRDVQITLLVPGVDLSIVVQVALLCPLCPQVLQTIAWWKVLRPRRAVSALRPRRLSVAVFG